MWPLFEDGVLLCSENRSCVWMSKSKYIRVVGMGCKKCGQECFCHQWIKFVPDDDEERKQWEKENQFMKTIDDE